MEGREERVGGEGGRKAGEGGRKGGWKEGEGGREEGREERVAAITHKSSTHRARWKSVRKNDAAKTEQIRDKPLKLSHAMAVTWQSHDGHLMWYFL